MSMLDPSPLLATSEERKQLVERNGLPDRISELIRDNIVTGRILPGTRLVEHQLANSLGVSRVPVREALILLERAGLVVSRPNGRYVLEISQQDIHQLFEVRLALERLAVESAAKNITPERASALRRTLSEMSESAEHENISAHVMADFTLHRLIWRQSDNPHLLNTLQTLAGPIYMFIVNNSMFHGWDQILRIHEDLVESIAAGDAAWAVKSIEEHMADSVRRAQRAFDEQGRPAVPSQAR
jgi:DNA-binding GntR family transcriptional regulator